MTDPIDPDHETDDNAQSDVQRFVWPNRLEEPPGQAADDDQSAIEPKSLTWQTTAFEADTGRSALAENRPSCPEAANQHGAALVG